MVTAFESEDEVAASAMVDRIDPRSGFAFLLVNRASMRDDDGVLDRVSFEHGKNRAFAKTANARAAAIAETTTHAYRAAAVTPR